MGLTVHFNLKAAAADCSASEAKSLVESMRAIAGRFYLGMRVDEVLPIASDLKTVRRLACDWIILPLPGDAKTSTGIEVPPEEGFIFPVRVGKDCEPLWLGLCRYPAKVWQFGREFATRRGGRWRLAGFSKTQFASLHGWDHFRRCHCAVVDLLAALRPLPLQVQIRDEGEYWPRRSERTLKKNLTEMNGLVAAAAGVMKDADDSVQSPIFRHEQYERLEAEGAGRHDSALRKVFSSIKGRG